MNWLDDEATTIALCWRIERRDGVTIGLTAHDRDLTVDGLLHRAAPGMVPSAIRRETGLDADTMEVTGALTAAAIRASDLIDGRWDGARVQVFAVDWSGASDAHIALGEGTIGAVELGDGRFAAELAGPAAALGRSAVEETSPTCRATLGDRRCRVAMAGRRRLVRIVTATAAGVLTLPEDAPAPGAYAGGTIRWLDGKNGGLSQAVAASAGRTLTLAEPPAHPVAAGTLAEVIEGCDRTLATCTTRFANAANFRGEPHLPGMDLVTRWIGS